jgi:N-acetylglutamate synthase-like GNAT family acetyltransferase
MTKAEQNEWTIRRATQADSKRISAFQRLLNRPRRSDTIASEYFLAEASGQILGCAAVRVREQTGYLYGLAVSKSWRRHGIGHALTTHRLDWLRETEAASAFVLAMFWNIRFFKQHGFERVDPQKKRDLANLHQDFVDKWSARSVLLVTNLRQTMPLSL